MAVERKLLSVEELFKFLDLPENRDRRFELIKGVIYEVSPSKPRQTVCAIRIAHFLSAFVIPRDLGYVTGADGGYKLSSEDFFVPDAAFIAKSRLPKLPDEYFSIAPDLAVEVVFPNDSNAKVHRKAMRYLTLGTRLVWVVYPKDHLIHVYHPAADGAHVQEIGIDGTLDGGEVLPDFTLPARDIFPA